MTYNGLLQILITTQHKYLFVRITRILVCVFLSCLSCLYIFCSSCLTAQYWLSPCLSHPLWWWWWWAHCISSTQTPWQKPGPTGGTVWGRVGPSLGSQRGRPGLRGGKRPAAAGREAENTIIFHECHPDSRDDIQYTYRDLLAAIINE